MTNKDSNKQYLQIFEDGRKYETTFTKKFSERKEWRGNPDPGEIRSVIPGSVTSISVSEGDEVKKGQDIMHYEAMKMINIIRSPFDGRVEKIYVNRGDKVPKGDLMIYLKIL